MKKSLILLSFLLPMLLGSCGQSSPKTNESVKQDSILAEGPVIPELITENFVANYKGNINHQYPINLELIKFNGTIGGSYHYEGKNSSLQLKGSIEDTGELNMSEYNSQGELTGYFEGKLKGEEISGNWHNSKRTKSMPFTLNRTSIASLQNKTDVLSDAMGQYHLTSISGVMGANTMFDTYKEKGSWVSFTSSNIGGVRDGTDIKLNEKDIELLNNLRLVVDDHLTVHVYAGLIELINCPFKADGMTYKLKEKDKSKLMEKMAALKPSSILEGNQYVLLADDQINFSEIISGNFVSVGEDSAILSYNPATRTFELDIFVGSCCDGNILTFTKD